MPSISAAPTQDLYLWDEIVHSTIEACILRKEGREREVSELLQERLPTLIRRWSATCGLTSEVCKQNLRSLFRRVQEGVEMGFVHRRLIVDEIVARLSGKGSSQVSIGRGQTNAAGTRFRDVSPGPEPLRPETLPSLNDAGPVRLRRRIAIDDVSGMLDAMAEAELETRREAILPMRQAAPALIHLFTEEAQAPALLTA